MGDQHHRHATPQHLHNTNNKKGGGAGVVGEGEKEGGSVFGKKGIGASGAQSRTSKHNKQKNLSEIEAGSYRVGKRAAIRACGVGWEEQERGNLGRAGRDMRCE